jgi:hypothetical protein
MDMKDYEKKQMEMNNYQTNGPGLYRLDMAQKENKVAFPWAPTLTLQKGGVSTIQGMSLIDVDSELMRLNRPHSKDPKKEYIPDENKTYQYNHVKDGGFHQENTFLNNPPMLLRGQTKNRWIELCKDPQENTIEPFNRIGENTYLSLVDNADNMCQ